jgi:peroxiredoxin
MMTNCYRYIALPLLLACLLGAAPAFSAPRQTLPEFPNQPAPGFTLKDTEGNTHRLSDYRGKVVVLNFWATWCPPCREEMPSMERARKQVEDEPIVILAVDVGEDEDTIFLFTGDYPVEFPLLMDRDGAVTKDYPVIGLPTTYIIDPDGIIRYRAVGSREWDDPALLDELRRLARP